MTHVAISIVMPCLNESKSLPHCIANAQAALAEMEARFGLGGEVVVADNGSTDGSQALARSLGATVIDVTERGYGAALIGGFSQARGDYLVMGDADGSYDFTNSVAMIERLLAGADLCMGSRFLGGIKPGAMPWKNRYIGNPALTGILNLFFRTGVDDAHCGLRAIRKEAFESLNLSGQGMEFASEMVIKASLKHLRIEQVPATLSPDLRGNAPHLRPWRDGWRHLRYLFMLSPTWAFGVPALAMMTAGTTILAVAILAMLGAFRGPIPIGESWTIIAAFLLTAGHLAGIMALATHIYGVRQGYRPLRTSLHRLGSALTLETALIVGGLMILISIVALFAIGLWWSSHGFAALPNTVPLLLAAVTGVVGIQTMLGGLLIAVIGGNEARFTGGGEARD
jgi:glycosyltransferase involved in cell wall biosynthesis